ncbi:MAG: hypothetical protein R2838_04750 [Caldilineaceae bacterium]
MSTPGAARWMYTQTCRRNLSLRSIVVKTVVTCTVTDFVAGIVAFTLFDYATRFADPRLSGLMRPPMRPSSPRDRHLRVVRGLMFGVVFYLLLDPLFTAAARPG